MLKVVSREQLHVAPRRVSRETFAPAPAPVSRETVEYLNPETRC
jgi:hypothetical protein